MNEPTEAPESSANSSISSSECDKFAKAAKLDCAMASFGSKKRSGSFDVGGTAAQKLAVESFKNIANTDVSIAGTDGAIGSPTPDPDVEAITTLVKNAGVPIAVADVAAQLHWDSGRASKALSRGGASGRLTFVASAGRTFVGLPAQSAGGSTAPP
jgi:hypothetical protein